MSTSEMAPGDTGQDVTFPQALFPRLKIYPGESAANYEGLRTALLFDLNPGTAYQHALAEQIVSLEWEAARHRRLRDALILSQIRDFALGLFDKGKIESLGFFEHPSDQAADFASDLTSNDPSKTANALAFLSTKKISADEIEAKAYGVAPRFQLCARTGFSLAVSLQDRHLDLFHRIRNHSCHRPSSHWKFFSRTAGAALSCQPGT